MSNGNLHGPLGKQISSLWIPRMVYYLKSFPIHAHHLWEWAILPDISNQKLQEHINITLINSDYGCWGSSDHLCVSQHHCSSLSDILKGPSFVSVLMVPLFMFPFLPFAQFAPCFPLRRASLCFPWQSSLLLFSVHNHSKSEGRVIIELHRDFTPRLQKTILGANYWSVVIKHVEWSHCSDWHGALLLYARRVLQWLFLDNKRGNDFTIS